MARDRPASRGHEDAVVCEVMARMGIEGEIWGRRLSNSDVRPEKETKRTASF